MIEIRDNTKCCGCSACISICPKNCITLENDDEGFWYPKTKKTDCIDCKKCNRVCPIESKETPLNEEHLAYASYSKDLTIRKDSSSGGIFTLLAQEIVKNNGTVIGASLSDALVLETVPVTHKDDIKKLRGAKYVQSDSTNIFPLVRDYLLNGKMVLFVGTPCQVSALYNFLGKRSFKNLLLVDFICHGVPSPGLWKKYIQYREKCDKGKMISAGFRSKKRSWRQYYSIYEYSNGRKKRIHRSDDPYLQSFLKNYSLRPSCYQCAFKGKERIADITLADFWMVNQFLANMDDGYGTSLVFVHSQKGIDWYTQVENDVISKEIDYDSVADANSPMISSVDCPDDRKHFFEMIDSKGWLSVQKTFFPKRTLKCVLIDYLKNVKRIIKSKNRG